MPFQFSLDGINFEKNEGTFQNLEAGNYNIYVTNAYDTLIINHTLGETTSIKEIADPIVTVFPNPSTGKVYFNCEQAQDIEVYNSNGIKIKHKSSLEIGNYIDLSNFENGIYFIQFIDNKKLYRKTIVKINN